MRLVYIAGPYSGKCSIDTTRNIAAARDRAVEMVRFVAYDLFPVVPHLLGAGWEDERGYGWWLEATVELMRRCDAVLLVPGWELSRGATVEREEAQKLGLPVFASVSTLAAWARFTESADDLARACDATAIATEVAQPGPAAADLCPHGTPGGQSCDGCDGDA